MGARPSAPRLFGIPATRAPIVAVIRRGPTAWSHVGRWADWDPAGRLLVATTDGRLQVRDPEPGQMPVAFEVDLASMTPAPEPPPAEAARW